MVRLGLAAICMLLLLAAPALARPGDVDDSFGVGGQSLFATQGQYGDARGLARQADGKVVVGLTGGLVRFNPDGTLDRTFGFGGVASSRLQFMPGQPAAAGDGKILAAGRLDGGPNGDRAAVARLMPNGAHDPSFGSGGLATVSGGGQSTQGYGVFEQADGKVVLLATASDPPAEGSGDPVGPLRARAARLMPDGSLDQSFGKDGWATLDVPDSSGLVYFGFEQDGKLIVGGEFNRRSTPEPDYEATIFRLHPDGSPDASFGGGDGIAQGFFAQQGGVLGDLDVQPDGKLLIAGGTRHGDGTAFVIARANRDGSIDTAFGDGGRVTAQPPGTAPSPLHLSADQIVVQPDGRIVAAGNQARAGGPMELLAGWALARFLPDGRLDPEFGDGGWSTMAPGLGDRLWPSGLARTDDGKLVVSGDAYECGERAVAVVRFHGEDTGGASGGPVMRTCDSVIDAEPDGDLPIEVACPLVEELCRGTAVVEVGRARAGKRSFRLLGGQDGTVRVRASRAVRRLVARRRSVRATLRYSVKDADGTRRAASRRIRIRR